MFKRVPDVVLHREALARDNLKRSPARSVGHRHRIRALHQTEGVLPRGEHFLQGLDATAGAEREDGLTAVLFHGRPRGVMIPQAPRVGSLPLAASPSVPVEAAPPLPVEAAPS